MKTTIVSSKSAGPAIAVRPKNWLLAKSRQWHKWGGLFAGVFILVTGASGILLNYKQPIFNALGFQQKPIQPDNAGGEEPKASRLKITTGAGVAALPVTLERALEIVRAEWGDVALERIELKDERGEVIYKLKQKGGDAMWVNARTGTHFLKGEYERIGKAGADGTPTHQTDWGRILLDLHTGRMGGEVGKAIMSLAALVLLFLTASGVYLWAKPLLIRRRDAQHQAATRSDAGTTALSANRPAERELIEA